MRNERQVHIALVSQFKVAYQHSYDPYNRVGMHVVLEGERHSTQHVVTEHVELSDEVNPFMETEFPDTVLTW